MGIALKALIPSQNASWARKQPTPLVLGALPALAVIERLIRNLPLGFGGEKARNGAGEEHLRQILVQGGDLLLQTPPAPLPSSQVFWEKHPWVLTWSCQRGSGTCPPGQRASTAAACDFLLRGDTLVSDTAASPRLVMLSPHCSTLPSVRRCSSWKRLPARQCYLISATGPGIIKGILLGFRVAKELRTPRNYGTGVV